MKRRIIVSGVIFVGSILSLVTMPALGDDDPLVGRWDMTIHHKDRPRASWLGVEKRDGKYKGLFLNEGGSPRKLGAVNIEGSTVNWEWRRGERFHKFTGIIKGDTIEGERIDNNNHKVKWTGRRFVRKLNVTGKWTFKFESAARKRTPVLLLKQQGDTITGKMKGGRRMTDIADVKLDKDELSFKVTFSGKGGKKRERSYKAKVKGDVLEGVASGASGKEQQFIGQRAREWGEPVELFNGKDLANWTVMEKSQPNKWKVIDGIMTNTGHGANIVCGRKFQDFKLHVEFKIPAGSNSGVYLRGRYEIQVEDTYGKKANPNICGSLYGRLAPSVNASAKAGEWQTFDVTLIDSYVTLVHNGKKTIDNQELVGITGGAIDSDEAGPGPFYLQGDHGAVYYRKITVTPAKPISVPEGL
ncbi:MAG: 3-keto-disaccharide hydrolase [Planctomycetota bacterium]|jgi:hypothetical protein